MSRSQEEKDKSILNWFSGGNPNRKKVKDIVEKRKAKEKKDKKRDRKKRESYNISKKLGM